MSLEPVEPIPAELRARNPLITPRAARLLRDLREHPDAPKWNYVCGDRLTPEDLAAVEHFREELFARRGPRRPGAPEPAVLQQIAGWIPHSEWLRQRVPSGTDLERDWDRLPCMTREDLACDMGYILPDACDFDQLWVYATSGTTGHAVNVPNSARGASSYMPLTELALARHGVRLEFSDDRVSCFLVCAQAFTITYATVHSIWRNSGFAKLNLKPSEWPRADSAARYFETFQPPLLTGDPLSFVELRRQGLPVKPRALVSTAVALTPAVRKLLEDAYRCPVIDTYSLNETGLVSYACPQGFHHVLPHDLHVELLGPGGRPVEAGARGEIVVSGGRNPFLPLLRYRTGDWARMEHEPCACGDAAPRLLDLEGRAPVLYRAADGGPVNTVDVSRVIRKFPVVQHRFVQRADGSCELTARPVPGETAFAGELERELAELFGRARIAVRLDPGLGDAGKVIAFESELRAEQ
jgi:phenylacetate-CoA ligase